jgi:hypothetical protein
MSRSSGSYDSDDASSIASRSSASMRSDDSSIDANSVYSERSNTPVSPLDRLQFYFQALSVQSGVPRSANSSSSNLSVDSTGPLTNSLERFNARVAAAGQGNQPGMALAGHSYGSCNDSSMTLVGGARELSHASQPSSGQTTARSSMDESVRPPVIRRNAETPPRRRR